MHVVGKSSKMINMTFADIARFSTLQEIHAKMVEDVFRSIENERSTINLIDKIISGTDADISEAEKEAVLTLSGTAPSYCTYRRLKKKRS